MEMLVIESWSAIQTPKKYRNELGQLLEHSPFSERDIKTPELESDRQDGPIEVEVRLAKGLQSYEYQNHPFDIIGWDGYHLWVGEYKFSNRLLGFAP